MLQIATFALPGEVTKANEFIAGHKVENFQFFPELVVLTYEDLSESVAENIANWHGLRKAAEAAKDQQEIALHMLEYERAGLNMTKNKKRFDELTIGINNLKDSISSQEQKMAYCETRIDALRNDTIRDTKSAK